MISPGLEARDFRAWILRGLRPCACILSLVGYFLLKTSRISATIINLSGSTYSVVFLMVVHGEFPS
ncbi:hypothetical protein BDV26DRAFT_261284 [Aspergillus bertholletiae]|uniref:Uncharacterized protein n=1 Tax=Aspergillus bertholletiae TaxID=1226010 RepID=A0A5N7BA77_9EURO|nr:hypothetical protein BDV26DRAFT_261284 [Aspergillus bertholletiae]